MRKVVAIAPVALALSILTASAQTAPSTGAPAASPAPASAGPSKSAACRSQSASLRGPERMDSLQLCIEEARLACLKQAIAEKVAGPTRKDYLKSCLGS